MNRFFPSLNMYKYPKYTTYMPPPNYNINSNVNSNFNFENTGQFVNKNIYNTKNNIPPAICKNITDNLQENNCNNFKNNIIDNKKLEQKNKMKNENLSEKPLFEILGIKLYNDDILILLLIFFLYKENVNDMLLLIALFSLLF